MALDLSTAPPTSALAPPRPRRALPAGIRGIIGFAVFLGILEILPRTGIVNPEYLPPTSEIALALVQQLLAVTFWSALGQTLLGWMLGLLIALVAACVLGTLTGSVPLLRELTHSTIEFLRPIPSVALIPLVTLLFGTSMRSTLVLVVYATIWPLLVQIIHGIQDVDPVAKDTARSYRFSPLRRTATVVWPSALPYAMTGFRLAAAIALILEVSGELIIGSPGIGQRIGVAQSSGAVPAMYALIVVTGILGVLMNLLTRRLEKRALHWHVAIRKDL
ncbi:MAG: ABC transporter permease [Microbacterium sp.]|uniref:ABC transporter permease n=1 Tax=Microbacterium sp. TaxID=51671 RepID=UPI00271B6C1C|nr:ABC transporter permease [Microbacterium sp.]MDO8382593.1 ABC transporter permease [Microbacterium sp.]